MCSWQGGKAHYQAKGGLLDISMISQHARILILSLLVVNCTCFLRSRPGGRKLFPCWQQIVWIEVGISGFLFIFLHPALQYHSSKISTIYDPWGPIRRFSKRRLWNSSLHTLMGNGRHQVLAKVKSRLLLLVFQSPYASRDCRNAIHLLFLPTSQTLWSSGTVLHCCCGLLWAGCSQTLHIDV